MTEPGNPTEGTPPAAPAPTPPAATPTGAWRSGLSSEYSNHAALKDFTDDADGINSLAKQHLGQMELLGRKGVALPGEEASEEDINRFYAELGRPESVEGYDTSGVDIPEGLPIDEGFTNDMVTMLHKHGISQRQLPGIMQDFMNYQATFLSGRADQNAQAASQLEGELRAEWGDSYQERLETAFRALTTFGGEDALEFAKVELADGTQLGNHPTFLKILAGTGAKLSEHRLLGDKSPMASMMPAEAVASIAKLDGNQEHMAIMMDPSHPQYAIEKQKREMLYRQAYPGGEKSA